MQAEDPSSDTEKDLPSHPGNALHDQTSDKVRHPH